MSIFPRPKPAKSAILKLGEDRWRIHCCGSPGIDGIDEAAVSQRETRKVIEGACALLVLHPVDADPAVEKRRAKSVLRAIEKSAISRAVIVYPNNDPGSTGIIEAWQKADSSRYVIFKDLPRASFLGLMRDAAVLVGNSSSGIIEAASFGTPVVDIGPRQLGREHGDNVVHVGYAEDEIRRALNQVWNNGHPIRFTSDNLYGGGRAENVIIAKSPREADDQRQAPPQADCLLRCGAVRFDTSDEGAPPVASARAEVEEPSK